MQTVGPQCAGKTTYLKSLLVEGVDDIATDNIPQVYEKVPVESFLNRLGLSKDSSVYEDRTTYGTSVFNRIEEISRLEQGLLTALFTGKKTLSEIEPSLLSVLPDDGSKAEFMAALKEVLAQKRKMVSPNFYSYSCSFSYSYAYSYSNSYSNSYSYSYSYSYPIICG